MVAIKQLVYKTENEKINLSLPVVLINNHYCKKYCHEYDVEINVHAHMIKYPKYSFHMSSTWLNIV